MLCLVTDRRVRPVVEQCREAVQTGVDTKNVLAVNVPAAIAECQGKDKCTGYGHTPDEMLPFTRTRCSKLQRCLAWITLRSA